MQTYEIPQNCPFSLPFPTVIAFHRVKKSPLIIGIVDRIKINSEQPLPFSESQLFIPYFLQIVRITYVCFVYFAAIAQVCINFHRQHVWQWWCERGAKSHVSKEISGRGRRRSRGVKGNQGVGDFRSINILQFFSIYYYYYYLFIIFSLLFLPTTFTPTLTTHSHDPWPLPTTHDPRHLATLGKLPLNFLKSHVGSFTSSLNWLMRRWKRSGQLLTSLPD